MPSTAYAHGVGHIMVDETATAMRFYYSDESPMSFAETIVLHPYGSEFLIGRTDARGYFAFIPTEQGLWTVEANDGMGHRAAVPLTIEAQAGQRSAKAGKLRLEHGDHAAKESYSHSKAFMALLGVSLLANLGLGITLYRKNS